MASETISIAEIISQVHASGARFVLVRGTGSFYLTRTDTLAVDLLAAIELNKVDIFIAIGGVIVDVAEDGTIGTDGSNNGGNDYSNVNVQGLIDLLREKGVELQVSEEITHETLNRHYFHFSDKLEAVASFLENQL